MSNAAFSSWPNSLWKSDSLTHSFEYAPPQVDCDVCIVGAGYSGLWTAIQLHLIDPSKKIVIVEAVQPGFGASGRNGGWCSAFLPMSLDAITKASSRAEAIAMQQAMYDTVRDIGFFVAQHRIECGWAAGGTLQSATNNAHLARLQSHVDSYRAYGFGDEHITLLSASQSIQRIDAQGTLGATYSPDCAAVHPGQLVDGLVRQCLANDVTIYGDTRVIDISPHCVTAQTNDHLTQIHATHIVRATEGYTPTIKTSRRATVPIYSYMVATEPLPSDVWNSIGWASRETFSDARNMVIYAQRTADNRIAFGGRGAPYRFGSTVDSKFDISSAVHNKITSTMHSLFPSTRDALITHRWGGPLGITRDWFSGVTLNHNTGLATLGGYVGDGVAASYLGAKTLAHLICDTQEPVTRLPWAQHVSPSWEPEPFRWLGINALLKVPALSDIQEARNKSSSWLLSLLKRFTH